MPKIYEHAKSILEAAGKGEKHLFWILYKIMEILCLMLVSVTS